MSMSVSEIKTAVKSLDAALESKSSDDVLAILHQLDNEVNATESLLRETKVGVHVNKARTYEDSRVVSLVKKIVKKWKDVVSMEKKEKRKPGQAKAALVQSGTPTAAMASTTPAGDATNTHLPNTVSKTKPVNRTPTTDGVKIEIYPDTTRNRSIAALYTALAVDSDLSSELILERSTPLKKRYSALMLRSLILNIKNKQNSSLREQILNGSLLPKRLVSMTSAELAPAALKEEMQRMKERNLFHAQGAVEKRAITDRFVCGKCKKREVSYYQMQTRSADEPLTTFCTCENCGNRWKFC
ncbi:transcription elongation factor S-II [Pichia kudriavzevii]|uniref:Transcription elongation factor n=1 Tax=Pichia kudriavzevii TaxID=4909 RepID=A0A1Z8JMA7_PICKU|nr:transcription elongation factor S-II [Pichia kudriavzevii]